MVMHKLLPLEDFESWSSFAGPALVAPSLQGQTRTAVSHFPDQI